MESIWINWIVQMNEKQGSWSQLNEEVKQNQPILMRNQAKQYKNYHRSSSSWNDVCFSFLASKATKNKNTKELLTASHLHMRCVVFLSRSHQPNSAISLFFLSLLVYIHITLWWCSFCFACSFSCKQELFWLFSSSSLNDCFMTWIFQPQIN